MEQQIPSPNKPSKDDNDKRAPTWIPAWMSERERTAAIIACGLIIAAFVIVCGGCCSGVMQTKFLEMLR